MKFISISELCKKLNLIDRRSKKPQNYILRYWEKEFKQIKPKKINNRRYYSLEQVEMIKDLIDSNFWMKVFVSNKEEVSEIKHTCKIAGI